MTDKELIAKVITKSFNSYSFENQEIMKQKYKLVIHDFKKTKHIIDVLENYLNWFKNIKKEDRIIIFYGVPVQLSNKQFKLLRILLEERQIIEDEFNRLVFCSKRCKKSDKKQKDDMKKTVYDFKRKFYKEIKKYNLDNNSYFIGKSQKEIDIIIKSLISYKTGINGYMGYTLLTDFKIENRLKSNNIK